MPDAPKKPEVPRRGRGVVRGRGGMPTGRLGSFRPTITGNTRATSSGSVPSGSGSALVFKPKTQVQRHKKEAPAPSLLASAPKREHKPHGPARGAERGRGRGRGRVELIQTVSGPFAQGPAMISSTSRRGGAGGFSGVLAPGMPKSENPSVDEPAQTDLSDPNAPVLLLTDHNEETTEDFDVQTEEMALKAAEEMRALKLDNNTAEVFSGEKLLVWQLPAMPEFELTAEVVERRERERLERRDERRRKREAEQKKTDEDVKPSMAELEAGEPIDVEDKPVDDKPIDDKPDTEEETAEESDSEDSSLLDGRIGTLVVLKSGAVKLKIGQDLLLDVSLGADCQFFRGLMALDTKGSNSAFVLGNIDEQLVCTPDLENML